MAKNISNKEFKDIHQNDNALILDVRSHGECCQGIIPEAINIDIMSPDFMTKVNELSKDKTILVYCRSGNRSSMACSVMERNGFKTVYNLANGIMYWDGDVVEFN